MALLSEIKEQLLDATRPQRSYNSLHTLPYLLLIIFMPTKHCMYSFFSTHEEI